MRSILTLLLLYFLTGCSQSLSDYQAREPSLDLKSYFDGEIKAWGLVSERDGSVKRRFRATINASWQGNVGTLDETFWFDDGETQKRIWIIEKRGDQYTGRAGDVIGKASGEVAGYAMNWSYQLQIPIDGSIWQFHIDDWLYQIDEQVLFNQGEIRKFGIKVGQITLFMQKQP